MKRSLETGGEEEEGEEMKKMDDTIRDIEADRKRR